ncbi:MULTISPECIES: alkaline phosphatase family protein [unclassified Tolypothrix]|uniref:alkaline phosphatase family protein n=1 Tax=unclassified Tolypothrix TaxID=2649714 RepID=UPI0005EAA254|nr:MULTISPECIES: nucleotide pyrophosphatase/phosphodiesterase family protein [unclassified Tolypothrix]BAY89246.1 type I phosphodiesterase/nucleotide pyrophosphatase [Microchaete diplosiphon NIES-3275]EKE97730.1 type I phosphodiesterase / nucleotide pyrophosphatase [Tolypothrix sp. PCC 7601]MBE9082247.1 alkaline phosphatase family protein [Tolypothrix sp. LEGE 11397]UYD23535.1 alkaline phosphatase family protein [Tolypothrix sp. PCC 7712]UYD34237.1 alkaline phosphatase family protein [Tolypoth
MQKTVVLNVVGLTPSLLGENTPFLSAWAAKGQVVPITPVLPAVTCSVQATYLTGKLPDEHGIVANGWYFRDDCEIKFWRQSNKLVQSPKIWEMAKSIDPNFTCANLFWWYNMYSAADYAITPRPMYPADGRKLPDIYTYPANIRESIQSDLGQFPLFNFWGPNTSIISSQWIANSAQWVEERYSPTLTLVYLPHLDYCLQKFGQDKQQIQKDLQEIDAVCGDLINYYQARNTQVIILSEYGITPVSQAVDLNRILRKHGLIAVREELGRELLDPGASIAFAVADHQVAHVYVNDPAYIPKVRDLLESTAGVAQVLDEEGKKAYHLNHPRSGELVAIAQSDAWFTYYYWLDDAKAPDFARTVDIHRKPGYDPVELFLDPQLKFPQLKIASKLLQKKLGFRYLMDVIPVDASLVRGSHGCVSTSPSEGPMFISHQTHLMNENVIPATDVCSLILQHLTM